MHGHHTSAPACRVLKGPGAVPGQIKQPTLSTGIALYGCTSCTLSNLLLQTAAGFGIYGA